VRKLIVCNIMSDTRRRDGSDNLLLRHDVVNET
jgi:hypothetical protein